ncbi:unnamed protein product [Albugo candida]|uniref:Uncharacterized protein n=1 Tax=Albugo candida TaxID=65357 RepID=A0A024G8R3_9STRA|nr:unnamed protein product [Albugo candida]|eukprot:CCI42900.1 unnamed protein product [Albugo candida]
MAPSEVKCDAKRSLASQKLETIESYSRTHQIDKMFHVMLSRLLQHQPIDPIRFLSDMVEDDCELDAVVAKARIQRFDLRRERTKKKLLISFHKRLQLLQTRQLDAKLEHILADFLLAQIDDLDTIAVLRQSFPKHFRMLKAYLRENASDLHLEEFIVSALRILQLPGTN